MNPLKILFWPPRLKLTLKVKGHFLAISAKLTYKLVYKRVRGSVYISCQGGGFCPHRLIFKVNNQAPRVF